MSNFEKFTDPYKDRRQCVRRLEEEYRRHGSLLIAFDFDNTVFDYHHKGYTFPLMEQLLQSCKECGLKLILFTAKENKEDLIPVLSYCKDRGYEPDYVNESPVMNTRKPYYSILLDDRAGLGDAMTELSEVVIKIKEGKLCRQ